MYYHNINTNLVKIQSLYAVAKKLYTIKAKKQKPKKQKKERKKLLVLISFHFVLYVQILYRREC